MTKKISLFTLLLSLLVLASPAAALAEDGPSGASSTATPKVETPRPERTERPSQSPKPQENVGNSQFCKGEAQRSTNLTTELNRQQAKLKDFQAKQIAQQQAHRTEADQKLASMRSGWDKVFSDSVAKIEAKLTGPAQQQAIATFQASVVAARTSKRKANDAAIATYRVTVDQAEATRDAAINQDFTTRLAAIQAALAAATASCASGSTTTPASIQSALQTARETATKTHASNVQAAQAAYRSSLQAARTTLENAQKANQATYLAALAAAKKTLQDTLNALKPSPTPTATSSSTEPSASPSPATK